MAFPPQFLEEIRDRVSLAAVIGRHVKLTRRGRDYVGLCPFHNEKTPSFNVVEEKNFYHCFGCGAHGDVIGFTMRFSNLSFQDAVEALAREAGLQVPVASPHERERAAHAATLHEVCEAACAYFERQLISGATKPREYLRSRGIGPELVTRFRLGYAPPSGSALATELSKTFPLELIEEAGLVRRDAEIGRRYDFFRDRVIFPIFDRRDRVIAFGGRILGDGQPKYLNSPDTPIFQKGLNLYALNLARKKAKDAPVIVVEGYTDVIALNGAGFIGAVAPLGTALGEHQIAEVWRLAQEPILCFDGDAAGRRAADKAIDRFLPLINVDRRLSFAVLPDGDDPDSLMQKLGPVGFESFLTSAQPLSEFLWGSATSNRKFASPEKLLLLERSLKKQIQRIEDRTAQRLYGRYIDDKLWELRQREWRRRQASRKGEALSPESAKLAKVWSQDATAERNALVLIATAINHPWAAKMDIDRFVGLSPRRRDVADLHHFLLAALADNPDIEPPDLSGILQDNGFGTVVTRIFASQTYRAHRFASPLAAKDLVTPRWNAIMSRIQLPVLRSQLDEAAVRVGADPNSDDWERLLLLRQIYEDQYMEAEGMRETGLVADRISEWQPRRPDNRGEDRGAGPVGSSPTTA